eukprot:s891_g26.t1
MRRAKAKAKVKTETKETEKKEPNFFPPDQVVYATVQWVLADYKDKDGNRTFSPICDDIEAMGCSIKLRNDKAGQSSRLTIKGEKARDAFLEFLSRTADAFGDLDLTKVSNVQMRLGAEMLTEVKQLADEAAQAGIVETDEFVPDWDADDMDDKYDDAEADAQEAEAAVKPELVDEEPEERPSKPKNADGGGLTPPAAGDGLTSSAASGAPPNRRWQVKAETGLFVPSRLCLNLTSAETKMEGSQSKRMGESWASFQ